MSPRKHEIDLEGLGTRIAAMPGVARLHAATERSGIDAYLVGGAVRDALLGSPRSELDVVAVGDHLALAAELGEVVRVHPRFATATVATPDGELDVAAARSESYARPGALPDVQPAGDIVQDLARRDFSINAIAVAPSEPGRRIDPHHGVDDLRAGVLRVLHEASLRDDPTRALRAARYAARLDLEPDPLTSELIARAELGSVSQDRVEAELRKLACEPQARRAFELLDAWGLIELPPGAEELIDRVRELASRPPWAGVADAASALVAVVRGAPAASLALADADPSSPSGAAELARGRSGLELLLARALGARWLDDYVSVNRHVRLEISGDDLIAAGVERGPAVGRGLAAALRAKLDGEVTAADEELAVAMRAAERCDT